MSSAVSLCYITLDDVAAKYSPGDLIKGKVICHFIKSLKIREVRVQLEGLESIEWPLRVLLPQIYQHPDYIYDKAHINRRNKILHDVAKLTGKGTYDAGEHAFPFTFELPKRIPSTFSGRDGCISFSIISVVDIPFTKNFKYEKKITVESSIDLNEIPWLNPGPLRFTTSKTLRRLLFPLGTVTMDVYLEKAVLTPGESTELRIKLKNSSKDVRTVEAKIIMTTIAYCTAIVSITPRTQQDTLVTACDFSVNANQEKTYLFRLGIPETADMTNLRCSKLFHRWTHLDIKAGLSGMHSDLTLSIPIKMGNITFRSGQNEIQRAFSASSFNFLWETLSEDDKKYQIADSALYDTSDLMASASSEISENVGRRSSE